MAGGEDKAGGGAKAGVLEAETAVVHGDRGDCGGVGGDVVGVEDGLEGGQYEGGEGIGEGAGPLGDVSPR